MKKTRFAARIITGAIVSAVLLGAGFAVPAQADTGWGSVKKTSISTTATGSGS